MTDKDKAWNECIMSLMAEEMSQSKITSQREITRHRVSFEAGYKVNTEQKDKEIVELEARIDELEKLLKEAGDIMEDI